ncbi:hypothetical protein FQR65_LT16015 [Abscondita terminalis]|nr:hypothetical protein FQR65_LT16015 [Abscondita terminalis]
MDYGSFKWDIIYWWSDESQNYDTADYIPSIWANSDKSQYKFPAGQKMTDNKKRHLIHNCSELGEGEFIWCKATCKKSNLQDLKEAQSVLRKAQYTSNLDTDISSSEEDVEARKPSAKRLKTSKSYKRPTFNQPIGSLNLTDRVCSPSPTIMNPSPLQPLFQLDDYGSASSRMSLSNCGNSPAARDYSTQALLLQNHGEQVFHNLEPAGSTTTIHDPNNMQPEYLQQFADIATKIVQAETNKFQGRIENCIVQGLNGVNERYGEIVFQLKELNRKYDHIILNYNKENENNPREKSIISEINSRFPLKSVSEINNLENQLEDPEIMPVLVNFPFGLSSYIH